MQNSTKALLVFSLLFTAGCVHHHHDYPDYDDRYDNRKVELCHKGKETIVVDRNAVRGHLNHGDRYGSCGGWDHNHDGRWDRDRWDHDRDRWRSSHD